MRKLKFRKLFVTPDYAFQIAKKYYSQDTFEHAMRVCHYIYDMYWYNMIPEIYINDCLVLAIMHDLLEDTSYTGEELPKRLYRSLDLLTKPKDMSYIEYINRIKDARNKSSGLCAWYVKLADMRDHLTQTETLTDRLKEKYFDALPYLL